MALQRVLSRHPSRGELIGLYSWHANIVSASQDLYFHSPSMYTVAVAISKLVRNGVV